MSKLQCGLSSRFLAVCIYYCLVLSIPAYGQAPPIPITSGGTGVATLPTGLLKGAGTSAITQGTVTDLGAQAANTVAANVTSGSAAPTAASLPSCTDSGGNHLNYTSGTGFSCGTSAGSSGLTRLTTQLGPAGNTNDTNEDTLLTYTMPGGQLASNGQSLRFRAEGLITTFSATTKTIKCYFGATVMATFSTTGGAGAAAWWMDLQIWRSGATAQLAYGYAGYASTANSTSVTAQTFVSQTPAETLSGTVVLKCTGQTSTASASVVVANVMEVDFAP